MKRVVAIIVFLSLMTQVMIHLGVWGYYEANKAYIAKNLCENRNKPEKKCCGKCYLRKQLKKVDEGSNTSKKGQLKTEKTEIQELVAVLVTANMNTVIYTPTIVAQNPVTRNMYDDHVPVTIFHPPATMYVAA